MPLAKPYPPEEIDYEDWNDLADNYAGKATTLIVDVNGKGDYDDIHRAIDALPSNNAGEILIRAGEYLLTKALSIENRSDLVIRGVGKATRLKVADKVESNLTGNAASGQKNVVVVSASGFEVDQHVCIRDSEAFEVNKIASISGTTLTMENNLANTYTTADGARAFTCHSAIYITGTSKRVKVLNLAIDGNRANQEFGREGYYPDEHQGDGVRLSSTTKYCVVEDCWIASTVAHGVCACGEHHIIAHNHCYDNGYDGINISPGSKYFSVIGNHCFDQVNWVGIQVGYMENAAYHCVIADNICYNNRWGMFLASADGFSVTGNVLKRNYDGGIQLFGCENCSVTGNVVSGKPDRTGMVEGGILLTDGCDHVTVRGNLVELGAGYGIDIDGSTRILMGGNVVRQMNWSGILVKSTGSDCVITGNEVHECDYENTAAQDGIRIQGDRCIVVGNRCSENDRYEIHIQATADKTVVLGNICIGGDHEGAIQDSGTNTEKAHNIEA